MALVLGWVVFAIVVGIAASYRGRDGFGWFLLALLISPLVAVILLLLIPSLKDAVDPELRKCPFCAEFIKREAGKCRHCGSVVEPLVSPSQTIAVMSPEEQRQKAVDRIILIAIVVVGTAIALWVIAYAKGFRF